MDPFSLPRRRLLALGAVALVLLALAGKLLLRPVASEPPPPPPSLSAVRVAPPPLVVDVVGAVRRPGLYRLSTGSRVADAVRRAGGPAPRADVEQVNLAAPLADGEQVVVPTRRPVAAAPASPTGTTGPSGPVQLSTATLDELDALPGVGPATAQRIIDYRTAHGPFRSVDELDAVPGIGPARLAELRKLVVP